MNIDQINLQIKELTDKINDPNLCQGTAETFSRISGYYRSINYWNQGKQQEYQERVEYDQSFLK